MTISESELHSPHKSTKRSVLVTLVPASKKSKRIIALSVRQYKQIVGSYPKRQTVEFYLLYHLVREVICQTHIGKSQSGVRGRR